MPVGSGRPGAAPTVHVKGRPEGRPFTKVRSGSELEIGGGAGHAPRLPVSPVPGVDSPGGPHRSATALLAVWSACAG